MTVNIASVMPFKPLRSLILLDCVLYLDVSIIPATNQPTSQLLLNRLTTMYITH